METHVMGLAGPQVAASLLERDLREEFVRVGAEQPIEVDVWFALPEAATLPPKEKLLKRTGRPHAWRVFSFESSAERT